MENLLYLAGAISWGLSLAFTFQLGVSKGYGIAMNSVKSTVSSGYQAIEKTIKKVSKNNEQN